MITLPQPPRHHAARAVPRFALALCLASIAVAAWQIQSPPVVALATAALIEAVWIWAESVKGRRFGYRTAAQANLARFALS